VVPHGRYRTVERRRDVECHRPYQGTQPPPRSLLPTDTESSYQNLIKLSNGEYIALERLESTYRSCNVVGNLCLVANSDVRAPIAVVFPHEVNLRAALGETGSGKELSEICASKQARDLVLWEMNKVRSMLEVTGDMPN